MNVVVNGEPAEFPPGSTVAAVAASLGAAGRGVAVALDAEVVPQGEWASTPLTDGARVEVVRAIQGG